MKIFTKLTGSFAIVALICAIVGFVGWQGIKDTDNGLNEIVNKNLPAIKAMGLLMEGMNGVKSAERTMIISSIDYKTREAEYNILEKRWATFDQGYNLYDSLTKTPEEEKIWQRIKTTTVAWKAEHKQLIEKVHSVRMNDIESLEAVLWHKQLDCVNWARQLEEAINKGQEFTGQLDPAKCGFGRWMADYVSSDNTFNSKLRAMASPHERMHALGRKINMLIAQGKNDAARKVFNQQLKPTLAKIERHFGILITAVQTDIASLDQARKIAFGSEHVVFSKLSQEADDLLNLVAKEADKTRDRELTAAGRSTTIALITVIIGIIIALSFGFFLSKGIAEPMNKVVRIIKEMSKGHLKERLNMNRSDEIGDMAKTLDNYSDELQNGTVKALTMLAAGDLTFEAAPKDADDALGNALKKAGEDLNMIINEINMAAQQIASGANEVSNSSQALSQGATESAAALEEISASMTELASQTTTNAENANQANQLAQQSRDEAEKGNRQMNDLMGAMVEINESSQNISKIIKVIDEIAFQTNLLALNAAVEAARAGKHGKGFAVVAEEVRNLAARSAKAARETAELIEGSAEKVATGSQLADHTAEALKGIVAGSTQVTDLVAEIAAASNEQANGIAQINQGLSQIEQVTQQNTAASEQGAAAAEELSSQAEQMREMLARFTTHNHTGSRSSYQNALPHPAGIKTARSNSPRPSEIIALDDSEFGKF